MRIYPILRGKSRSICLDKLSFCSDNNSRMSEKKNPKKAYRIFLLLVVIWCSFIILSPIINSLGGGFSTASDLSYYAFGKICHQIEGRSFILAGEKLPVCSRCSALYFGFLFSLILFPFYQRKYGSNSPPTTILIAISGFMGFDVFLTLIGLWESTMASRVLTGMMVGSILPFYIVSPLLESVNNLLSKIILQHSTTRRNL